MKSVDVNTYLSDCGRYLIEEEEDRSGTAWYIIDRDEWKTHGPFETLTEADRWINAR